MNFCPVPYLEHGMELFQPSKAAWLIELFVCVTNINFYKYYKGNQVKDGMDGAYSTHVKDEKCLQNYVQKI
jgi:hypothetical protein